MTDSSHYLINWINENIEEGDENEYIELADIKNKCVNCKITSTAIAKIISQFFRNVNVKTGRSKTDWCKLTKKYYGIHWKNTDLKISFNEVKVPDDFFIMAKQQCYLKVGHLTSTVVNGSQVLIEITLNSDSTWSLFTMGSVINPVDLGLDKTYNSMTIFEIVRKLRYCDGVQSVVPSKNKTSKIYVEHVSKLGDENSPISVRYRSKSCTKVLPFKTSTLASNSCPPCKYLNQLPKNKPVDIPNPSNSSLNEKSFTVNKQSDVELNEEDHTDMHTIFNSLFPQCTEKVKSFLMSQKLALERHPHGRRWNQDIVRMCLTLWCRSPRGYAELRSSNFLALPSQRLLQIYKNIIHQEAGIHSSMLHWMASDAKMKNLPPEGFEGGLIFDEMALQPDLQFKKKDGDKQLIGFTECTPESVIFDQIKTNKKERTMATHVLQFMFLGFTGFRFPFAHFPSATASGHELYLLLWKAVNMLLNFGFKVQYISTDGAQTNRDLFKLLLPDFKTVDPVTCSFKNIYSFDNSKIFFIMDISHVIKKIRNNILKSGSEKHCTRHLKVGDKFIEWNHFKQAYLWDISSHPFPVHNSLTQEHLFLNSEAKMRNHLAEQVLNSDMLHLMELYKNFLGSNGTKLDATIDLLRSTSVLIKNFRDHRPITECTDERLTENHDALDWFVNWERSIQEDESVKNKENSLISYQTRQDIVSAILGFEELCVYKLKKSHASIIPSRLNSDIVENTFCQQRTLHNGANTHPTYLGYCHSLNSVILGQTSISRKSNTGGECATLPQTCPLPKKVLKEQVQNQEVQQ